MTRPVIIVAATSARMLAESARRGGLRSVALDLFGDTDTRRAAHWIGIGNPRRLAVDAQRMHAVLARLARLPGVVGWVAGAGFEDRLDLLRDCAGTLPLIGNSADVVALAKQPADFFAMLDRHGVERPEYRLTAPPGKAGWLRKRAGATGGWHVRRLGSCRPGGDDRGAAATGSAPKGQDTYYQREAPGMPMSALFLADGVGACLLGFNRQLVGPVGGRPYVFQGAIGPVAMPDGVARVVRQAIGRITRDLGLLGLNSLDFLLDGERVTVLELNPRPSATLGLHDERVPGGLLGAHIAACRTGTLPPEAPQLSPTVNGYRVVYACRSLLATQATQAHLLRLGWCHDIGPPGTLTGAGEPLCSVSAAAAGAAAVIAQLDRREHAIRQLFQGDDGGDGNGE